MTTPVILFGVAAWLLCMGATLFFVKLVWINKLKTSNQALQDKNNSKTQELELLKKVVSNLKTDTDERIDDILNKHNILNKVVGDHKNETTKIFETITDGFEFVNAERTAMIKDLAELKRRVRMNSNETKRQTFQRRHRENKGSV